MADPRTLPSPCLVVLVGPVASGKSTWASEWFAPTSIVSSDALRAVVGEGEHDLAASIDAFAVLDEIVARRCRRRLTTVVDTLGSDADQRRRWRELARAAGMPCVAVVFDTPPADCRRRNSARAMPVRSDVVARQLRRWPEVRAAVEGEAWDEILHPEPVAVVPPVFAAARRTTAAAPAGDMPDRPAIGMKVGLHLSSFEWPGGRDRIGEHLDRIAADADAAGVAHVWVMDHLRQIPQVGAAWHDLLEPFTTLAHLAARTERARLGVLVSPAFLRPPALLAKAIATLDVLSGGRVICGLGVGWFAEEYAAAGIALPTVAERYVHLTDALTALPLLWGKGAPAFDGGATSIPEALSYPRPIQPRIPILVGGGGERRTLRLVAEHADACNLFGEPDAVARKVGALRRHCADVGRDPATIDVTHLSTVVIGRDRAETTALVDRLRPPRRSAERFARDVNAGTVDDHIARARQLAAAGVTTIIVRLVDVAEPSALERLGLLVDRLSG
jgi:alkanesulfonate monooxygenase SsuD/methylene tetrahydromethanopterin reductase-like flavin-dependent oxidoreductase (luciferase family)/predicted kinase